MNFYDVLAAEKWGGGIPTINFFDLLFAQSISGEQWQVYEGTLPATFNANGSDMRQYQIYGNTGGVGDRTVNLFDYTQLVDGYTYDSNGQMILNPDSASRFYYAAVPPIQVTPGATYLRTHNLIPLGNTVNYYDSEKNFIAKAIPGVGIPFTVPNNCHFITYIVDVKSYDRKKYMLTEGSTAPASYVPFGYEVDMATGSNILQSSEIEWGGWQAAVGTIPSKIVNPARCRSKNIYPIFGEKIFYDFKSLNVNIAFVNSDGLSLGGTGFKSGVGSVDVPENAVECLFIIANTDASTNITPAQVIAAGIWASADATITSIYIGDEPLDKDEYIDYQAQKVYHMINGTLTPTDPPVPLPEIPTLNGTTVIDYAGQSVAPEKVLLEYAKGGN